MNSHQNYENVRKCIRIYEAIRKPMKNVLNSVELYEHLGKSVDLCENPGNAMSLYEYVKYITFSSVYDTSYRHQAHRALKGDLHEDQFAYHNMYLQGQRKE